MICNTNINLGDIDTSNITDMSGLFDEYFLMGMGYKLNRKDFKGLECLQIALLIKTFQNGMFQK